jgi:hypothetical protein
MVFPWDRSDWRVGGFYKMGPVWVGGKSYR